MCGVGCHPIHRAETLCWVMSPLQGRWMVEVTFQFVGPRPYAMLYCPFRASITLKGFNNLAQGLAPVSMVIVFNSRPYRGLIIIYPHRGCASYYHPFVGSRPYAMLLNPVGIIDKKTAT